MIYTSGTTGLPKAANVSHHRLMHWSFWFAGLMNTARTTACMTACRCTTAVGGVVATGAVLVHGGSVVIREKFSAREFWDDIADWDCTLFQYIGELCRYLVNAPQHPRERTHRLRLAAATGCAPTSGRSSRQRFAIPRILEFYAATEGNVSLYNVEGKAGAIGRVPPFLAHRFPLALVKFDAATRRAGARRERPLHPLRSGEVGEAIGRIHDGAQPRRRIRGLHQRRGHRDENPARRVRAAATPGTAPAT